MFQVNPPTHPGYSQSRSMPSNPNSLSLATVESTKMVLLTGSWAMMEYLPEPAFHPPTERMGLKWGNLENKWIN